MALIGTKIPHDSNKMGTNFIQSASQCEKFFRAYCGHPAHSTQGIIKQDNSSKGWKGEITWKVELSINVSRFLQI